MGHHIDDQGRFQSDRHPDLAPDKIVLSFHDPVARQALRVFAEMTRDRDLADDVHRRLDELQTSESRPPASRTTGTAMRDKTRVSIRIEEREQRWQHGQQVSVSVDGMGGVYRVTTVESHEWPAHEIGAPPAVCWRYEMEQVS